MKDSNSNGGRNEVAVFRYGVIADLVHAPPRAGTLAERIREKAMREHSIPGSSRTRISEQTIRDWLRAYRRGGFEALVPKVRNDRGKPRAMSAEMIEALLAEKRRCPKASVKDVIGAVRASGEFDAEAPMPASTVHRLFTREGLMRRERPPPDRRRFSYEHAGELWMSDVMHSVGVHDGKRRRKTYMIAVIDDATRVVPFAAFDFSESAAAFMQVFKQAIVRRGLPRRLYVDNGSAFRSEALALTCAKLDIALVHARPYMPAGKGKIERFIKTCRMQFEARLCAADLRSLETLNRKLHAWIEGECHRTPHRGLDGMTPLDKWGCCCERVRLAGPQCDLDDLFLFETVRKVTRDRIVSVRGRRCEADAALIGQRVTVRFDPLAPPTRPVLVEFNGKRSEAHPLDAAANARARRQAPRPALDFAAWRKGG